jgi:hypothetical protein
VLTGEKLAYDRTNEKTEKHSVEDLLTSAAKHNCSQCPREAFGVRGKRVRGLVWGAGTVGLLSPWITEKSYEDGVAIIVLFVHQNLNSKT